LCNIMSRSLVEFYLRVMETNCIGFGGGDSKVLQNAGKLIADSHFPIPEGF